uniref:Uncharacterized protein n=1 Tax=Nelumbo nucifera TaxID=4432 RepID=A0A822XPC9_NELNU|nr:TPA_asm: hypothetical protein HUJ06_022229 [Nelumbo nucifera]
MLSKSHEFDLEDQTHQEDSLLMMRAMKKLIGNMMIPSSRINSHFL